MKRAFVVMSILSWLFGQTSGAGAAAFKAERDLRATVIEAMQTYPQFSDIRPDPTNESSILSKIGGLDLVTNVGNLFDYLRVYPEESAEEMIGNLIRSALQGEASEQSKEKLVPMVRAENTLTGYGTNLRREPIVGDLVLTYVFDQPDGYAFASQEELDSLNIGDLQSAAMKNLAVLMANLSLEEVGENVVLYFIAGYTGLTPGLLLLDDFWIKAEPRFPEGALVVNPRRDQIFLIDKRDPKALDYAGGLIDGTWKDEYALQSRGIYERRDGKLVLIEMH